MMHLSTIPIIFLVQCGFLIWGARVAHIRLGPIVEIISVFSLWGFVSAWLALSGVYDSTAFLTLLPGFWLPMMPIVLGISLLSRRTVRRSLLKIVYQVPPHAFVVLQSVRIAALGTLIKTIQGQFPVSVELAIGLTDLAYGVSALFIYRFAKANQISLDALVLWQVVGILIIVIPGELAIQTALPGPLEVFSNAPTASVMLDYPMVLAPSLVVPIFFLFNAMGAASAIVAAHSPVTPTAKL
ncbi:MAG: hypothetical protein AB8B99_08155 [Phormidesmis sp.]